MQADSTGLDGLLQAARSRGLLAEYEVDGTDVWMTIEGDRFVVPYPHATLLLQDMLRSVDRPPAPGAKAKLERVARSSDSFRA